MTGAVDRAVGPSKVLRLGPRARQRPADHGWTLVAGIEARSPAMVDGGGLVSVSDAGWSVDWWIGADDRWHVPAREPAVRQRRLGHGPIIETSLRVPSGDVVHTVYPVVMADRTATVIEIRNDSPVPVALALALRPYSVDGEIGRSAQTPRFELRDETIEIGGRPAVRLPRRPNQAGASVERDLLEAVEQGSDLAWPDPVGGPSANAVCLYPLPHKTSLRFVVGDAPADPATVPDAEGVARGWTSVVERAARFEFPDSGITALTGAARARLILAAPDLPTALVERRPGSGAILHGLAVGGHRFECRPTLEAFARTFPTGEPGSADAVDEAVAVITAIGVAAGLVADRALTEALLEPTAQLVNLVERAVSGRSGPLRRRRTALAASAEAADRARGGLAVLVARSGQEQEAEALLGPGNEADHHPVADLAAVTEQGQAASPAGSWSPTGTAPDDAASAARFWLAARGLLLAKGRDRVQTRDSDRQPTIEVLPVFPTAWRGGGVEVHQAPIADHQVSFAIRWHGYRPALLWEVTGDGPPPRLRCPGLDPDWHTDRQAGEDLLTGSADALPDTPRPGDSFA